MSSEDNVYGVMTCKGYVTCTICNGNKKYLFMVQKCRNNVATIQNRNRSMYHHDQNSKLFNMKPEEHM